MRRRLYAPIFVVIVGALFALQWSLHAQAPVPDTLRAATTLSSPPESPATTAVQQASGKRPLSYDVVDYWRSIQGTRLSNDGQWLAYSLTTQAEDPELVVRNLRTGQEYRHPRGTGPTFTEDGRLVIFTVARPKAEEEAEAATERSSGGGAQPAAAEQTAGGRGAGRGSQARNEPRTGMGIMTLADGKVTAIEKVGSFRVPEESSTWLAYYKGVGGAGGGGGRGGRGGRGVAPATAPSVGRGQTQQAAGRGQAGSREKRKDLGFDLILRNLASGEETTIPEVTEYLFDKRGSWLAYATSSNDAAKDGAFVRRMSDGTVTAMLTGRGHYKSIAFDESGQQIAFLSDQAEYEKQVSPYRLYLWRSPDASPLAAKPTVAKGGPTSKAGGPAGAAPTPTPTSAVEIAAASTPGMVAGWIVADSAPRFSRDGTMVYISTQPAPPPPPDPNAKTPAPLAVDLWSWKDPLIQPMQKVRAEQERNRSYRALVRLADKRFVQLATPDLPNVNPGDTPSFALGTSDLPYRMEISWDQSYNDVYLVDLDTGKPRKVLEHWGSNSSLSPGGKYVLYFDDAQGQWYTYRVADGVRTCLTEKLKTTFQRDATTPDLPGPFGTAGWTDNDQSVLLYDEFDIWEVKPDGTGARIVTNGEGRTQGLIFRYSRVDQEEPAAGPPAGAGGGRGGGGGAATTIPTDKPLMLSTTNERTRASGFYRVPFAGGAPSKIVMLDKAFGPVTKARKADTVVFTLSRFDEFPDLWVASDTNFRDIKKVSDANPQQAEFVWGKSELIDYINGDGKKLRAILTKPDNFDPSKKYPLMVYIYEELTQGLHSYSAPNVGTSINLTRYVSNGYVLLRPDIVYETGFPGQSAEKCVLPAINTVVAMGFIDPKRIGIQGHSWGAYQITYLITRTNMFAAVEAGAAVVDMVSAYGGIRWGTGMVREFQYEKTQSRIGAPPWEEPLLYIENSPIFWIRNIQTPYLTIANNEDDAVPWYQGIEFNTAMRRLGKEAYMFSYDGERHSLRNRDNMKHWTVHMDEFFDHYLLGKPRPEWMDKGVPYITRGTRDVSPLFKKKTATTTTDSSR